MECSHDILDVEPPHDRNPRQPHRLPAPVPRRRRRPLLHRNKLLIAILVLGRLSDGHPLQRHLRLAVAEAARDRILPQRDKGAPSGPGRSPEGKMPVAGADERGDGNAKDLGNFAVRNTAATAIVKTDGWRGCSAVPRDRHRPLSAATGPPMKLSPESTPRSATSRAGRGGVCHGLRAKRLQTLSRRVRL